MSEPIFDPAYWRKRMARAIGMERIHLAVFEAGEEVWLAAAEKHREILSKHLEPGSSVIDVGCGWGRLLNIMPGWWEGFYLGVDLSPDFVQYAREVRPERKFMVCDVRRLSKVVSMKFDWAVLSSVKAMVLRNVGKAQWDLILREVKVVADKVLILEYDPDGEGEVL